MIKNIENIVNFVKIVNTTNQINELHIYINFAKVSNSEIFLTPGPGALVHHLNITSVRAHYVSLRSK